MRLELVVGKDDPLYDDDSNQDGKLVSDRFIVELDFLLLDEDKDEPSKPGEASHLEDLRGVCLSKGDLLVWQLLFEHSNTVFEVRELLVVSE